MGLRIVDTFPKIFLTKFDIGWGIYYLMDVVRDTPLTPNPKHYENVQISILFG